MSNAVFQESIAILQQKMEELKELKKLMRDIEQDVPMELEELELSLKDLKKQVKAAKEEHLRLIMQNNVEYNEYREKIQMAKEEMADAKLKLFTAAANESREQGDLDQTVVIQGAPFRLQTQKEIAVYLNGKVVKS